jgi:glycosyltransferase involved in cell wall biosynthesis
MKPLSIYIPTWNRPKLLDRLLQTIEPQLNDEVDVFVSINKSTGYTLPNWVKHRTTRINVGGDANIIPGPTLVDGEYVWVIGDDEQLLPDAIQTCLNAIKEKPGLIIHPDGVFDLKIPYGSTYKNYTWFLKSLSSVNNLRVTVAHTLISSNTFIRSKYDPSIAIQKIDSRYGFHYGMLNNLFDLPVKIADKPTMIYGKEASIFLNNQDAIDEHMSAYPTVIYDIFDWIQTKTGRHIPQKTWGRGFT